MNEDILERERPDMEEFVIAVRPHLPGFIQNQLNKYSEEDREVMAAGFDWVYNQSEVISIETARTLAKPGHGTCGGKGFLEMSRIPIKQDNNVFVDQLQFCDCALRNGGKMHI